MYRLIGPLIALIFMLIAGCSGITEDPTKNWSPEKFYTEAKKKIEDGDYETGIKYFETLEARYPYGRYAEQTQLEIAYAYYKYEEPALAIAAAERFIRLHPTHPNVDYAYYIKGLVNFRGEKNLVNWLLGSKDDLADRDPKGALESYNAFNEIVTRFPNSRYAADARQRMAYLFEAQAKYESLVARFYYERSAYVAAVNRAKYALEKYPRTPSTEDALGIMALSYKAMGVDDLATDTLKVLRRNFPDSRYIGKIAAQTTHR
ncbi:MAG: outer membrane protein assembly factor BamD [Gammaproteobacteria bacterium]|nr:outer membrane protein assembly factor BamD [Gammaproteobacteria bacterium]MDH3370594.1 outer membrane protein assembly factor BamD [Gammaproteobacteria bacterium]MDH3407230.1 outer membrane protein assembly factor BamD [Gammaproteobacteria bacterium]MDH3562301.1 outer membrane protein assembly factor BamD [Gammaproteobacteria bacterium]MDH5487171.1 outer membrane protein assembly factor BamD [Gammaproteobacteria bacterium]